MELYEKPEVEIVEFEAEDVIARSKGAMETPEVGN